MTGAPGRVVKGQRLWRMEVAELNVVRIKLSSMETLSTRLEVNTEFKLIPNATLRKFDDR